MPRAESYEGFDSGTRGGRRGKAPSARKLGRGEARQYRKRLHFRGGGGTTPSHAPLCVHGGLTTPPPPPPPSRIFRIVGSKATFRGCPALYTALEGGLSPQHRIFYGSRGRNGEGGILASRFPSKCPSRKRCSHREAISAYLQVGPPSDITGTPVASSVLPRGGHTTLWGP